MKNPLFLSICCAVVWSIWPILGKFSKLSGPQLTIIVISTTAIGGIIYYFTRKQFEFSDVTASGVIICLIAGILNVTGMIMYGNLLNNANNYNLAVYLPILSGILQILFVVFAWLILKEKISTQQGLYILGIVVFSYLLGRSK